MKKTFLKFEFTPTEWATLRKLIETTTTTPDGSKVQSWVDCAVVEIGFICLEWGQVDDKPVCTKQSDKWAVDILFYAEVPKEFEPFAVYPNPCGVHTFSGDDSLYLKGYCAKFPESDYCKLPEPVITNEAL
jgi:hypothetical protein